MTTMDNMKCRSNWVRALYMLLFALIFNLAEILLWAIVTLQFGFQLFTGAPNPRLLNFSRGLNAYLWQILQFETYRSEVRPYPFAEWPEDGLEEEEPEEAELTAVGPPHDEEPGSPGQ